MNETFPMLRSVLTIYALEPATGGNEDVVAVRTQQFDGIVAWNIDASTRYDIAPHTVHARARPKDAAFIFFCLKWVVQKSLRSKRRKFGTKHAPSPAGQHALGCIADAPAHTAFPQTIRQLKRLGSWRYLHLQWGNKYDK